MNNNFWQKLSKPFIGLSPMDGITDLPFREIIIKYGQPDLVFTEFVSAEGLTHNAISLLTALKYYQTQTPIVAQLFGKDPASFREAAIVICELGFAGLDINMGCPAKTVAQNGSGAALIKNPKLAQEIILAAKAGVADFNNGKRLKDSKIFSEKFKLEIKKLKTNFNLKPNANLPVSVKTRIGFDNNQVDSWIPALLETKPAAISLHGRTLKQQYSGEANWEVIAKAAQIIKQTNTLVIGNGDIKNKTQAEEFAKKYGVDGVLIGRASFGNPFVFNNKKVKSKKLIKISLEHAQIFEKFNKNNYFLPMRKHLAWYIKGIENAAQIRRALMKTNSAIEVKKVFEEFKLL